MTNNFLDTEITPDLLREMFLKQYHLQSFMTAKRHLQEPPELGSSRIFHEHVLAAIYFTQCMMIEFKELQVEYDKYLSMEEGQEKQEQRKVALEELIDCWHFILAVGIFLGLQPEQVSLFSHFRLGGLDSFAETVGDVSMAITRVIQNTPYKTWKNSQSALEITDDYRKLLASSFSVCYNDILDFAFYALDSSYEEFVAAYNSKNQLNFRRQEDPTLGYMENGDTL